MSKGKSSVRSARKPSLSRIKSTESGLLKWEGKAILFGNRIKKIDTDLKNLDKSNVRLKATQRIKLMKSKTSFDVMQKAAQKKVKDFGDRLTGYSSVKW
jgi:hypothetical protein